MNSQHIRVTAPAVPSTAEITEGTVQALSNLIVIQQDWNQWGKLIRDRLVIWAKTGMKQGRYEGGKKEGEEEGKG